MKLPKEEKKKPIMSTENEKTRLAYLEMQMEENENYILDKAFEIFFEIKVPVVSIYNDYGQAFMMMFYANKEDEKEIVEFIYKIQKRNVK
jgi:hypothetical protein